VQRYKQIIPIVRFSGDDLAVNQFNTTECIICMESFVERQLLRRLNTCSHMFHEECLFKWFASEKQRDSQKCPNCNVEITVRSEEAEPSSTKKQRPAVRNQGFRAT
jgi:hypothetical protein